MVFGVKLLSPRVRLVVIVTFRTLTCLIDTCVCFLSSRTLKLRDHPLMIRKDGFQTWPPRWTPTNRDQDDKPLGEVGTLENVTMSHLTDTKFFLFTQHRGFQYMGFMDFDDFTFSSQIFTLLKANIGRSMKDIGNLDVP